MSMISQVTIRARPGAVWPFVANPNAIGRWNPKLETVHWPDDRPVREGDRFHLAYRLGESLTEMEAEVRECRAPEALELRLWRVGAPRAKWIAERYALQDRGGTTRLVQEIDLRRSGIPRWGQWLIGWAHRATRPTGKTYLEELRDLVEAGANAGADP